MPESRISDDQLAELVAEATPGPWFADADPRKAENPTVVAAVTNGSGPAVTDQRWVHARTPWLRCTASDAALIAAAPSLALDLQEARAEVAKLRDQIDGYWGPIADENEGAEARVALLETDREPMLAIARRCRHGWRLGFWLSDTWADQWVRWDDSSGAYEVEPMEPRVADLLREIGGDGG
jgi:hypothetical protein